jgi:VIT1/CCC1 family predicted Fe2+/Mn2+ transporter
MPSIPHIERHFNAGNTVRDVVIGMSDGLTVPFALAAGLTGAISQTHVIVTAGLIPLSAYLLIPDTQRALQLSVVVTLISLAVFGGVKGLFTGVPLIRSGFQTTVIGGLAAAAAFGIARWIG